MRTILLFILLLFIGLGSYGQKMTGLGGELSVLSFKPNVRAWLSKTKGFDVFAGISSEMSDFKPNDFEAGIKLLNTFLYNRTDRTYLGLMGKWKSLKVVETQETINLPVVGVLIGKEWSRKKKHRKGFAIELGYQYGTKSYDIYSLVGHHYIGRKTYDEFPLILNLRYSLYHDR